MLLQLSPGESVAGVQENKVCLLLAQSFLEGAHGSSAQLNLPPTPAHLCVSYSAAFIHSGY